MRYELIFFVTIMTLFAFKTVKYIKNTAIQSTHTGRDSLKVSSHSPLFYSVITDKKNEPTIVDYQRRFGMNENYAKCNANFQFSKQI